MNQDVEGVLQSYQAAGLSRLDAIRVAISEEKLERDTAGKLKMRDASKKPGRRLLGI
jgi:hypothetical protein